MINTGRNTKCGSRDVFDPNLKTYVLTPDFCVSGIRLLCLADILHEKNMHIFPTVFTLYAVMITWIKKHTFFCNNNSYYIILFDRNTFCMCFIWKPTCFLYIWLDSKYTRQFNNTLNHVLDMWKISKNRGVGYYIIPLVKPCSCLLEIITVDIG